MSNLATNRKAGFNYEFINTLEAGIELFGFEVKAVKEGKAVLEGSHVSVRGGEAFLIGASIAPYQPGNTPKEYEATRNRKLLLTKKEIAEISDVSKTKGLTLVPISMYNKGRRIKVGIAIARGKKKFDKREKLKKRDDEREIRRTLKNQ